MFILIFISYFTVLRRVILSETMGNVKVVRASAGSGKTYRLAYEYVRAVVEEPLLYRNILAVTFTNKATEEMKRRIVSEFNALASGRQTAYMNDLQRDLGWPAGRIVAQAKVARTRILHDYSRLAVLTIDKFFQRIIRSFIKELGIDLNFNLELQTDTLLSSATDALIDDIGSDAELRAWMADMVEERIEQGRKWEVKGGLSDLGREIFREEYRRVAAGVRSRSDHAASLASLQRKVEEQGADICAEARRAMGIMEERGLGVDDFSNKATGVAGYIARTAAGNISMYGKRVADALESEEKWVTKSAPRRAEAMAVVPWLRVSLEKICAAVPAYMRLAGSAALIKDNFRNFALLGDLAGKVEMMCSQNSIIPISETNAILSKLVSGNDTPFIFEKVGNRYERFMMDEFQDTSAMQWDNFLPLLHNAIAQSDSSPVLIVGDVKQSIYRWRGGDWQILGRRVGEAFDDVAMESLEVNYRSYRRIVEFNNDVVGACVELAGRQLDGVIAGALSEGMISEVTASELTGLVAAAYDGHAQRPSSDADRGYVNITMYAPDEDGGQAVPPIIRRVEQLQRRGYAPGDIAFLVRSNREGEAVAAMLLEYKGRDTARRYCYDVVTQEALTIGLSPVVRFAAACMELSADPGAAVKRAVYNRWHSRPVGELLPEAESRFISSLAAMSPEEAFEAVVQRYDLGASGGEEAYLQAFHEQIISFGKNNVADVPLFLRWWNDTGCGQSVNIPPSGNAMTIITVHKAKGLDFKAVIIPYCDWSLDRLPRTIMWAKGDAALGDMGFVPLSYKKDMAASYFSDDYYREMVMSYIDNINLLYVALTRAGCELHIMIPALSGEIASGKAVGGGRIGGLLLETLDMVPSSGTSAVNVGGTSGRSRCCGRYRVFEFGAPSRAAGAAVASSSLGVDFVSVDGGDRLRLRFPSMRYAEGDGVALRDYGILMHKAFETAVTSDDIFSNIEAMRIEGMLSEGQAGEITATVRRSLSDSLIASWFDGSWDEVRNENDVIMPAGEDRLSSRRPDRVMVKDGRAVVVDYKFGMKRDGRHLSQMRRYLSLLRTMGYGDVKGYIWYVSLSEVEHCV